MNIEVKETFKIPGTDIILKEGQWIEIQEGSGISDAALKNFVKSQSWPLSASPGPNLENRGVDFMEHLEQVFLSFGYSEESVHSFIKGMSLYGKQYL